MWDLPGAGIERVTSALAGGFLTTAPPRKPRHHCFLNSSLKREIGTIIRSLGCCPSEGELHDLILEVEEEEPTGYIRFEKFLPVMTEVLLERRYRPIPEDILLRAFEVLDPAKRGFLSKEELIKYMTEEGEPFSQEEMEEMLSAAIDPESNSIHYKDYITMMVIDEN
ncbi:dynein regulatory complex protein 8 isoform X3 [Hippopotamus amphibius kiboko]|uniref:dynein regulatory complex protein 8 isoform X3 n=1 Tax=Hippopotamus amphibius kiboko TaxID=575201 RepID=UPI0025969232|nr:dynein regulatory complex protein 8 isoform X3 [Hippopotamus amphibius kiboko]